MGPLTAAATPFRMPIGVRICPGTIYGEVDADMLGDRLGSDVRTDEGIVVGPPLGRRLVRPRRMRPVSKLVN